MLLLDQVIDLVVPACQYSPPFGELNASEEMVNKPELSFICPVAASLTFILACVEFRLLGIVKLKVSVAALIIFGRVVQILPLSVV